PSMGVRLFDHSSLSGNIVLNPFSKLKTASIWSLGISISPNLLIRSTSIPACPILLPVAVQWPFLYSLAFVSFASCLINKSIGSSDSKISNAAVGVDVITPVTLRHVSLCTLVNFLSTDLVSVLCDQSIQP